MHWIKYCLVYLSSACYVYAGVPTGSVPGDKPQRCSHHRVYGMQGAYCASLNLQGVPNTLRSNIQILDVTFNRIRVLRNSTFQQYPYLRYIYLSENMLQIIETGTFDSVPNLETLDLTTNSLTTIPEFIFNLPSLRKLYIADNNLNQLVTDLKTMNKPFQAPLTFLSIAECELTEMPDFGIMPTLEHLNISSNKIIELSPKNFVSLCEIKLLDLTNAMLSQDYCTYTGLSEWFKAKDVTILPDIQAVFNTDIEDSKKCTHKELEEDDIRLYNECRSTVKTRVHEKNARKTWIIIGSCIGGGILIFAIILYWIHKRNVKRTTRINKTKCNNDSKVIDNLLNDVS